MFSRPLSSGSNPVPTSISEPTRPWISARPLVGSTIRERILSKVLFPAPFRPMMPTICPCGISKEASRSAQMISDPPRRPFRLNRFRTPPERKSRRVSYTWLSASMRYFFDRARALMAVALISDHVREGAFHAAEVDQSSHEQQDDHRDTDRDGPEIRRGLRQHRPAEPFDHRSEE